MEIKIGTKQILLILQIIAWIIFIGLCVEAGSIIVNTVLSLVWSPEDAKKLWNHENLSGLLAYDRGYFVVINFIMLLVTAMKALIFYLIIKILLKNKLDMVQPFTNGVRRFIVTISYLALLIGFFSNMGARYCDWLREKGVKMAEAHRLNLDGADVWLFMCVTLFVIAQIFKRGIEIQTENELTV